MIMKVTQKIFTTLALLGMTLYSVNSRAVTTPPPPTSASTIAVAAPSSTGRLWNLQDADILSVINEVSLETGKNFAVDPRVTGKISLISSKPIQSKEVYQIFLSVLELLGYSAIPSGNVIKIVPNIESSELATRVASKQSPGKGDEVVVRIIPLENISATQIIPVLRPLLPQWSNVSVYTPGNVLILVGRAANLQRIVDIIQNIDTTSTNGIDIVPLHAASASQIATVLSNLQNASKTNGNVAAVSIAADERSNSILLSGNKAARLRTRLLISQLDSPTSGAKGNTEVIYLRYLQAKNLAPLLGKIAQNMAHADNAETATIDLSTPSTPGSTTPRRKEEENSTNIQAETNTNALIITAPPALMKALHAIVAKLDIRPAQVLVEAIIVEIDEDDMKNLGIQWGSLTPAGVSLADQSPVPFPPLGAGTVGIIPGTQIRAVLSALQNKTGVNILSTPSLVVLDNQKAVLKVGKDVPDQTGSYATTGSTTTVSPFNTIGRKLVALQLAVTPQINLGEAVRLKINLTNDTLQNPDSPTLNPLINTSQIENSVIINSDDILVLGGLISNNITESTDKVPILGDIPLIGLAFQHKIRKVEKKNLMAFIKPTILHNADDATNITNTKYDYIRHSQTEWPVDLSHEGAQKQQNILPLRNNNLELPKPFES
jgi:general secretion pathway protein D